MSPTADARLQAPTSFLNFGPWQAELRGDELTHIRHRGIPVLRGLRAVVRNHNWLTLTPGVQSSRIHETADSLKLILEIAWAGYSARYAAVVEIAFRPDSITVSFDGSAAEEFAANRIGLVVLHRPDDAGRPVAVTSPEGNRTEAAFPTGISPHQPFQDIAALEWERDHTAFRLDFDGDVFETEDQRNWTDASFKTYSTPLAKPFPVVHRPGDAVWQSIRLSARQVIRVTEDTAGFVPQLGTSAGPAEAHGAFPEAPLPTGFGYLLAEVAPEADQALGVITPAQAVDLARRLGLSLDARIVASAPGEAAAVVRALPLDRVLRLGVYGRTRHVTDAALWDAMVTEANERGFGGELVAGARGHFTELNRNRDSARPDADGVTYAITPQMHATEPGAMIESLAMQTLTAAEALDIGDGNALHIGPVTLAPRYNAVATQAPLDTELPTADALQDTAFARAWLLGSITALTRPGTSSISYATAGELGSPAGRLLLDLAAHRGSDVLTTDAAPVTIAVYPVRTPDGVLTFVGNLTAAATAVRITGPTGASSDLTLDPWQTTTVLLP